ncbi:MAG: HAMP domain-containing protein [Gammaproteobacteria bacterium]|nr:HAMP domain-containing protein [Gammaproteobacteria bacterium]
MKIIPQSLLSRTALTISLALLLFMIITLGAAIYFVAMPIAKRSADDLAALMILAANTWHESVPEEHANLRQRLMQDHGLAIATRTPGLPVLKIDYPYFLFLRDALARRTGESIDVLRNPGGHRVWVDIPVNGNTVRVGLARERISASPPLVLLLVISGGALLVLITSIVVVRRVIGPLERLSHAVQEIGQGSQPPPLAEDGPEELATLARVFNRMSLEVHDLLENRTVMVAGISHDLRTPLTRLGLAIEMIGDQGDPKLVAGIRRDLAAMENLVKQFMELAQGLSDVREEEVDLWQVLRMQVEDLQRAGHDVRLGPDPGCHLVGDPFALARILTNLLDNAAHYGNGKPVDAELQCEPGLVSIRICDRGPGIPEAELEAVFRPFHRLDTAREDRTGGSGLGLAIARQLANKNGWTIDLKPRPRGGTVAVLHLRTRKNQDIEKINSMSPIRSG